MHGKQTSAGKVGRGEGRGTEEAHALGSLTTSHSTIPPVATRRSLMERRANNLRITDQTADMYERAVTLGLGRIVASHHRSSSVYQIHGEIR